MATYEYQVNLTWPGPGSPGVNVWHFRAEEPTGSSAQDCVDVIHEFYTDVNAANILVPGTVATGDTEAIDVDDQTIVPVAAFTESYNQGSATFAGPAMMVLTLATSTASRSGRGRKFLGPISSGNMAVDGTPIPGAVTGLQAAGTALVAASQGLTLAAIGVYSPTQSLFRDLVSTRVRDTFAVLRSRRD